MKLLKGQKVDITKGRRLSSILICFGWQVGKETMDIDAAAFMLSASRRCEQDEHFIFYGNPEERGGSVHHTADADRGGKEQIAVWLDRVDSQIEAIAFTVTIHEAEQLGYTMQDVSGLYVSIRDGQTGAELYRYEYGAELTKETAVVAGELYRHNGEWKFNAIGSGYYGGLAALCRSFGLEVEESSSQEPAAAAVENPVPLKEEAPTQTPIDLRKRLVQITLEKKQLSGVIARVGLVLDISGSMIQLYRKGTVQQVVERILAVACKFDDNATLDVWVYDSEFSRLPSVTEHDFPGYVNREVLDNPAISKFRSNNEPLVMEDVLRKYIDEEPGDTPVFIIFINDGGVDKRIRKVISNSAVQPVFWQFVGIGTSNFKVLKELDTMKGRIVDNAGFFQLHDIENVSDEQLYDQLLNEFPKWITAATAKGIIKNAR